ncbi:gliding motility-associated C-terminal domain-containing protein [Algoriphagus boritolerans]|uniref:gliding motility-associated C-terminal domain-containing protein n=1 Tax=Algoriphagus boritolerans TaxID=308111 RepID=UPI0011B05091|nr:gliding motility-associated C-terminal domain-containing protein [Algoriphagus boritolerans]
MAQTEFNTPSITGPDRLCIQFGSVIGEFSGGGDPTLDVYEWKIFNTSGQEVFNRKGGFETISYTFEQSGSYQIELIVSRASIPFPKQTKNIFVQPAPEVVLKSSYQLCGADPLTISAVSPSSPNLPLFEFEWKDSDGKVIGTNNTIVITSSGNYTVDFFIPSKDGLQDCYRSLSSTIIDSSIFEINSNGDIVCPNQGLLFSTEPNISGNWYTQKEGETNLNFINTGSSVNIDPGALLSSTGNYDVIFEVVNPDVPGCVIKKSKRITYSPLPDFEILDPIGSSGCNVADGTLRVRALTAIDYIFVEETKFSTPSLAAGEIYEIQNLESGAYNLTSALGPCVNSYAAVVPIEITPPQLIYDLIDFKGETCTDTGKELGSFTIKLENGPSDGYFRVLTEKGETATSGSFLNQSQIPVTIPGGKFVFELLDLDSCTAPRKEYFEIPGKNQVQFSIPSELSICQSFDLVPTTSENLEFTLIAPDGTQEVKPAGEPLVINQAGKHKIIGKPLTASDLCPTSKEFNVVLVDPVEFEPILVREDCFGNRTYEAEIFGRDPENLLFTWYNEKDEIVSEGIQLIPISTGLFKLDVQSKNSEACPIPPKEFIIQEPVLEVEVSLSSTKLCELKPSATISFETTFEEEVTDIYWRRFEESGEITLLLEFKDSTQITVDVPGIYEASAFSFIPEIGKVGPTGIGCELGRNSIEVDVTPNRVTFQIPETLSICETYEFSPETNQDLDFTVTYPDGEIVTKASTETFILNQEGIYTFFGFNPDPTSVLCPDEQTMEVTLNQAVEFSPKLQDLSCTGIYEFSAEIGNYTVSEVDIFWRDQSGNLIGSDQNLILSTYGTFTLEVQPKGSIPCQIEPISFEAPVPVLSLVTEIIAETLCPDQPDAALKVDADLSEVSSIEWWYTDINNNRTRIPTEPNQDEILAAKEGTYEVLIFNQFDCLLGRDQVLILRSTDSVRPIVEESYQICPRYEIGPQINPGNFANYEWYFETNLVSNSPTYKPNQLGQYKLVVFSTEGCAYETSFFTEEECELRVVFPNAIQPGNPDKPFLIYTNYLIDELEIWIFSKWGEVIFHCKQTSLISEESTCLWDGYFNGQKIPPGSYAYRMNFRNNEKNLTKEQLGSILFIN